MFSFTPCSTQCVSLDIVLDSCKDVFNYMLVLYNISTFQSRVLGKGLHLNCKTCPLYCLLVNRV